MKKGPALIAALITTFCVGLIMLAVGVNAFLNPTDVASAQSSGSQDLSSAGSSDAQVQQLQNLVSQYQAREKQYQSQLDQLKQQLNQQTTSVQQYQSMFQQLQEMGVLVVRNGQVFVNQGGSEGRHRGSDDDHDDDENSFNGSGGFTGPGSAGGTGF